MKKFSSVALTASMAVVLAGCGSGGQNYDKPSQQELAEYCGMDLDKITQEIKQQNQKTGKQVNGVVIRDTDCNLHISYVEDGQTKMATMDNDSLSPMLAYGGMGALFGYLWANNSARNDMINDYRRHDKSGIMAAPYAGSYFTNNSRALAAYGSGNKASSINVSRSSTGQTKISTRTNAFRGISSSGRSSAYSGG